MCDLQPVLRCEVISGKKPLTRQLLLMHGSRDGEQGVGRPKTDGPVAIPVEGNDRIRVFELTNQVTHFCTFSASCVNSCSVFVRKVES